MKLRAVLLSTLFLSGAVSSASKNNPGLVNTTKLKACVEQFNSDDEEFYSNIKNSEAFAFLKKHSAV